MRFLACINSALIILVLLCATSAGEEAGKIEFSGALEGEFGYVMVDEDSESDFALAKVELGADASLSSNVSGHILFLYEQGENDDNIAIDEGFIDLNISQKLPLELSLSLGFMCVPFGEFNSHFVTDPFTLEIGETKQTALQISASQKTVKFSMALYNEEMDDSSHISDLAVKLSGSSPEGMLGKDINLSGGVSFISNMAGTDGLTDMIGGGVSERSMV